MFAEDYGFLSLAGLADCIRKNLHRVPRDIDIVVGIPRSGMIPAYILGLYLNLPVLDLPSFIEDRQPKHGFRPLAVGIGNPLSVRRVLLVDDSYFYGNAMGAARTAIREAGFSGEVTTCAVVILPGSRRSVDLYFTEMAAPRIFEWNMFHNYVLEKACLDFDGVLCVDPTDRENDDGPEYEKFLANARPLHLPSLPIGHIVSARLEKYRPQTEAWLARHDVKYGSLHLLNLPSGEDRRRTNAHHAHKIRVYRETRAPLFIESSDDQAREIARQTGWPVLSLETMLVHRGEGIYPRNLAKNIRRAKSGIKDFAKRTIPYPLIVKARDVQKRFENLFKIKRG